MKKVQSQLIMSQHTRDRADSLAFVRGESRAEVLRQALDGDGLTGMERKKVNAQALDRLAVVADALGMTTDALARRALADKIKFSQVVEAVEAGARSYDGLFPAGAQA